MWTPDDVTRSIRRYLGMTLAQPPDDPEPWWRLRVERREVRDEDRPVGVIVDGPITTARARSSLIQGNVEDIMPVTISLYPEIATPTDAGMREARLEASQLKAQIKELFDTGLTVTTEDEDGNVRHWAGPFRIPLWDYEDVKLTGKDKAGPEDPHDVLWVIEGSLSVDAVQDPEDAARWAVIANFRVSIERAGRVPADDELSKPTGVEGHIDAS